LKSGGIAAKYVHNIIIGYRRPFPRLKLSGREVDNPAPSDGEVKNDWSYTPLPPRMPSSRVKRRILYKTMGDAQWLRYYDTNRQVAGSIPDGVIGIFQ
jgi:hypothetical protein